MAVVLVLIALAMIAGGVAAVVEGVPVISLERGWALVIAGAAVAGSGAVLAGIGIAVSVLRRIERELGRLRERDGRLDAARPAPPAPVGLAASREAPTAPVGAGASEPPPVAPPPPRKAVAEPVRERAAPPQPVPATTAAAAVPDGRGEPALAAAPAPDGSAPASAEPVDAATQGPTVVGTYNSGGNRYVMFSDGSIEAETPNGQFRFNSLDELKAFIASGGEEAAPAA